MIKEFEYRGALCSASCVKGQLWGGKVLLPLKITLKPEFDASEIEDNLKLMVDACHKKIDELRF